MVLNRSFYSKDDDGLRGRLTIASFHISVEEFVELYLHVRNSRRGENSDTDKGSLQSARKLTVMGVLARERWRGPPDNHCRIDPAERANGQPFNCPLNPTSPGHICVSSRPLSISWTRSHRNRFSTLILTQTSSSPTLQRKKKKERKK